MLSWEILSGVYICSKGLMSADSNRKKMIMVSVVMIMVSVVGRQQNSTTWVMGPNIQMDQSFQKIDRSIIGKYY